MDAEILRFKIIVMHLYMRVHGLTPEQFLEQEIKYGIFKYIEASYEWLYLTGDQGVIEDIDAYISIKST